MIQRLFYFLASIFSAFVFTALLTLTFAILFYFNSRAQAQTNSIVGSECFVEAIKPIPRGSGATRSDFKDMMLKAARTIDDDEESFSPNDLYRMRTLTSLCYRKHAFEMPEDQNRFLRRFTSQIEEEVKDQQMHESLSEAEISLIFERFGDILYYGSKDDFRKSALLKSFWTLITEQKPTSWVSQKISLSKIRARLALASELCLRADSFLSGTNLPDLAFRVPNELHRMGIDFSTLRHALDAALHNLTPNPLSSSPNPPPYLETSQSSTTLTAGDYVRFTQTLDLPVLTTQHGASGDDVWHRQFQNPYQAFKEVSKELYFGRVNPIEEPLFVADLSRTVSEGSRAIVLKVQDSDVDLYLRDCVSPCLVRANSERTGENHPYLEWDPHPLN